MDRGRFLHWCGRARGLVGPGVLRAPHDVAKGLRTPEHANQTTDTGTPHRGAWRNMQVLHKRCAGLDVHKETVVASVRRASGRSLMRFTKTFGTTTAELGCLAQWLSHHRCTHVAMEATGVYWKPVWHVLEEHFELVLANAYHVRNVPGRKTDVNDATWLADLMAHGLVRSSFVPETTIQQLRALTRTRKQLVHEKTRHIQRIHKALEDANVKLASAVSDIMGATGRAILQALIQGESDPTRLAKLADQRIKAPKAKLTEALRGRVTPHHRFLLRLHFEQIRNLETAIADIDKELGDALGPLDDQVELLTTMPGISNATAQVVVSEIGTDMSRFPRAAHLVSWAGLCPRSDESAGKRRSTRVRQGTRWLKAQLVQAAWAAVRKHDSYLRVQFLRLKARRGPKKAILAVAASMLTAAYHMLKNGVVYMDLGPDHFNRLNKTKAASRLIKRLEGLGYKVEIQAA